jgi:mannose-6-phosphate isomerase-like protein (cupin superfamily)
MYVIKEPKDFSFQKAGIKGKIFPISSLTRKTEYFLIETAKGHETVIVEHTCDFIYSILEGNGYFVIDGKKESCTAGDLVVIPAGKTFTYKGNLKMMATSTPPWQEDQEETLTGK